MVGYRRNPPSRLAIRYDHTPPQHECRTKEIPESRICVPRTQARPPMQPKFDRQFEPDPYPVPKRFVEMRSASQFDREGEINAKKCVQELRNSQEYKRWLAKKRETSNLTRIKRWHSRGDGFANC